MDDFKKEDAKTDIELQIPTKNVEISEEFLEEKFNEINGLIFDSIENHVERLKEIAEETNGELGIFVVASGPSTHSGCIIGNKSAITSAIIANLLSNPNFMDILITIAQFVNENPKLQLIMKLQEAKKRLEFAFEDSKNTTISSETLNDLMNLAHVLQNSKNN